MEVIESKLQSHPHKYTNKGITGIKKWVNIGEIIVKN